MIGKGTEAAMDVKQSFGSFVRKKRKQFHLSQDELAYRADLHRTYVTNIEQGTRNISFDTIVKISSAFDVSLSDLFQEFELHLLDDDRAVRSYKADRVLASHLTKESILIYGGSYD